MYVRYQKFKYNKNMKFTSQKIKTIALSEKHTYLLQTKLHITNDFLKHRKNVKIS